MHQYAPVCTSMHQYAQTFLLSTKSANLNQTGMHQYAPVCTSMHQYALKCYKVGISG